MEDALLTIWNGLPVFLVHSAASLALLIAGMFLYVKITPHDEIKLIRAGNTAAALSLGGAMVGLALPLSFSLAASVSLWDLLVWGVVALVFQLIAFRLVGMLMQDLPKRIEAGEMGAAIVLVSFKLATACINSAAIAG